MFTRMAFNPATGLNNKTVYPTTPESEEAARAQIQGVLDQLRVAMNGLLTELEKTTAGSSGAENIGSAAIIGVDGTTIREQIADLYLQMQNLVLGEIDPETILSDKIIKNNMIDDEAVDTAQMADDSVTADKLAAGAVGADALDSGAVTADALDSGAVKNIHIDTGAVTPNKIDASHVITAENGNTYAAYPPGISYSTISSSINGGNFPESGTLLTINHSNLRLMQILVKWNGSETWTRSYRDGTWQSWIQMCGIVYGTSATPPSGTYPAGTIYVQYEA